MRLRYKLLFAILFGFPIGCIIAHIMQLGVFSANGLFCEGLSIFVGVCFAFYFHEIQRRQRLGIPLTVTLETKPEKVQLNMLHMMWTGPLEEKKEEFDTFLRYYPDFNLQEWEILRSWYKAGMDVLMKKPDILELLFGSNYSPETDPLYDPDAPDWERWCNLEQRCYYGFDDYSDYDDSDDYDDFDDGNKKDLADAAADGFAMGVGFGIAQSVFGGND